MHNSVEHLIDELKHEYKLNENEVTQIKIDMNESRYYTDKIANSIWYNLINKDIFKNNMLLSLIDKKINTAMRNESAIVR